MKHKQWASLLPFILVSFCSSASTVNNYLSQAKDNPVNLTLGDPAITSENWRGSYSENKELRVEDNGTSLSFRMRPKYGSERDIERAVFSESERQNQLYANQVIGNDLRSRYSDIIDMLAIELNVREFQDRCSLLKLESNAESARSESMDFDAIELQDLMLDLEHCETQLNLARQKLSIVRSRLNITDGNSRDAFINDLISPEQIRVLIQSKKDDVKNPNTMPRVMMAETQKKIAESQLKLQKIADGFGVQLLELKYDTENSGTVGITVGFRIPNGGNAKNIKRHRDQSKAQIRHLLAGKNAINTVEKTLSDIDWGYNAWQSGQRSLKNVRSLMDEPSRRQTPRLFLRLRHQQLMLLKSLNQTHIELLENYIELLHITGLLTEYPLRNWLHKSFQGLN